ncbi:myb-like protein P isoform X5 [Chironomus tepperi]|uniref:myb-like protein P isoform X5 n=1 Tax=Chironomus tepperi TaxID=113505 RepID=UPI00391F4A2D
MSVIAGDLEIRKSSDLIETKVNNNISNSNNSAPLAKREEEDDDEDEDVFNNESTTEVTQTTETVKVNNNNSEHNKGINDNNKIINDSNNNNNNKIDSTSDQPQIIQTDEIITVVVNENCNGLLYRENLNDNYSNDKKIIEISESVKKLSSNENFPKSILCANSDNTERKSLLRKKSVSFEKNEEIKKFIVGEEIIDKQNPFRSALDDSEKFRIIKTTKKSSIPTKSQNGSAFAPLASEENDFITKEEILKQSKYVQVYVKNPDKVLTYDRTVLDKLKVNGSANTDPKPQLQQHQQQPQQQQRIPVPLPRKSTNLNNSNKIPIVNKKIDKKEKKRNHKVRNPKYPDLSDIKVKIGTDIDESLYDPNEVVLNAKKFDSRFKKIKFGSTDDLEEIVDKEDTTVVNGEEKETKVEEGEEGNEKKSYTNTVNSEEFRQYLKKKGLVLFPIKTSSNGIETTASNKKQLNGSIVLRKQQKSTDTLKEIDEIDFAADMDGERNNGKKKSVFHRLSSIFSTSKGKTTPKTNEPLSRISYSSSTNNKNHYNHQHDNNGGNLGSNIKRVILERSNFNNGDNRSVSANSEFMQHFNSPSTDMQIKQQPQPQQNNHHNHHSRYNESDDTKSSISSVLTAAADDDPLDTPINVRKTNNTNQIASGLRPVSANATAAMLYRNIDLNKSKLYQTKVKQNNNGNKNEMNGSEIQQQQQQAQPQHYSLTTMNNGTRENDDIIKPRVQRPSNLSRTQPVNKSLIKPPVPLRRTIERQSMPIMRSGERYKHNSMEQNRTVTSSTSDNERTPNNSYINGTIDKVTSTPTNDENMKATLKSPKMSPIVNLQAPQQQQQKPSEIDPITFAKIHEIKKKTDEVLLNKTNQLYSRPADMKILQNNLRQQQQQNFVRNSPQRATITDVYQNKNSKRDDCGNEFMALRQSTMNSQQQNHVNLQPQRSQSVLDNMTLNKNSLYGEVTYRRPDGSNVNVLMRRPESTTIDRNQIMQKIYEYYRKSVNNTPVSFTENSQKNLQYKTQSTDTSPVSYASVNTMRSTLPKIPQNQILQLAQTSTPRSSSYYSDYSIDRKGYFYNRPSSVSTTNSMKSARNQTISESDSVFLPPTSSSSNCENEGNIQQQPTHYVVVNSEKLRPFDVLKMQQYNNNNSAKDHRRAVYVEPERIYDVVYGASSANSTMSSRKENASENTSGTYGNIINNKIIDRSQKIIQRPASAMGGSTPSYQQQNRHMANGRMTPLILQTTQGDIIYNNQIYRPISTIPRQQSQQPQQQQQQPQQQQNQPIYSSPMRRRQNSNNNYESDSEAGEIQSIMQRKYEEDYQNEKSSRNQQNEQVDDRRRSSGRRSEDPRRHTLGTEMMHYANQGGNMQRSMDLEGGMPIRAYTPQHQGPLFDDDPGIMSEVETASTGFRRGGKSRSSLPVVRTPSKTLERPLGISGLVFLQYRSETKRALLPNEITSIDTVRALFVRSFPRQLSMAYLEGPNVKIYIHDSSKDMFYELEDVRSHLREIRDRSVLRLFESNEVAAPQALPGGPGIPLPQPVPQVGSWDHEQSYFSEPEFDSEYQHQHIHKSKTGKAPYYVGTQTLPRGHVYRDQSKSSIGVPAKPMRSYGSRGNMAPQFPYPTDQLYSIPDGYMSSPERGTRAYEEPYYTQYGTRGSSVTPIIDEEQSDAMLIDDQYSMYGMKRISRNPNQMYDPARPEDLHRIRVEHMERQLANLTGLVQKALVQNPQMSSPQPSYIQPAPGPYRNANSTMDDLYVREKPPKLGKSSCHKSVSFEKSVSFSDDIQGVPKAHSPQHMADSKPPKPAIKSSTLPRTSSQAERDRLKPAPPLKQNSLTNQYQHLTLAPEVYNHLRGLQKKTKDLKSEVKTLRRLAQSQAIAVREDIKDTFMRIRATLLATSGSHFGQNDQERTRISREEEIYKQEVIRLEKDLADLEGSVEVLRGEVINRRTRVNMAAVEDMALVLSRASKTVAELKMRFPGLQSNLRNILSTEMDRVCREEKFLKEEPDRLEIALRRCKKLTGTLVTLKRLASVQEQRTCVETTLPAEESSPRSASETSNNTNKPVPSPRLGGQTSIGGIAPENALDALLDELQTFAKPPNHNDQLQIRPDESTTSDDSSQTMQNTVTTKLSQSQLYPDNAHQLRRLHSYPSGSDTEESPPRPPLSTKPPVPERNSELLSRYSGAKGQKKVPPPPPPRTSSRSPLASPTSPSMTNRCIVDQQQQHQQNSEQQFINNINNNNQFIQNDQDSGSESANSQDNNSQRQMQLELRHQELLKKQKQLQEQYQRLQQMSKNAIPLGHNENVKRMGSDTNLAQKLGNLKTTENNADKVNDNVPQQTTTVTTNKVYETDIL